MIYLVVPTRQMSIESLHQSEGRWKYLLGVLMAFISGREMTRMVERNTPKPDLLKISLL